MSVNKNIYFICSGLSTNDIISSLNFVKKNMHNTSENPIYLKKNDISRLDKIGFKQLYLCQENQENSKIFDRNSMVYTSLDYQSIESSFVLFKNKTKNNLVIYPLPHMSNDTNIKNITIFDKFKKKFGKLQYIKNKIDQTDIDKYWEHKFNILNFKNQFYNIMKFNGTINWKYTTSKWESNKKEISSLNNYSFTKFKILLEKICIDNKNKDIIIITTKNIIIDILKIFKKIKFDMYKDNLEYTSIWKINISVDYFSNKINYIDYDKIYPTEYNYKPLKYNLSNNSDTFEFLLNSTKYILFNSLKHIPIQYLLKINYKYQYYTTTQQKNINTIIKLIQNNNKKKPLNKENKEKNNNKSFEELTGFHKSVNI